MGDRDAPFVVYRRQTGFFTIVPRGRKGWIQVGAWIALLIPLVIWFAGHSEAPLGKRDLVDGLGLFCIGIVAWLIGGIWWMLAHGEVIDMAELMRDKYMKERKRRRVE